MRRLVVAAPLVCLLSGVSAFAQAPAQTAPPAPAPAAPTPAQAAPPPPAQPAQPPAPFPQGWKVGFVDFQRVAQEAAEGQISSAKINALVAKKQAEGAERNKQLQVNQQKLQQSGGILSEQARTQLEKDIERQQRDGERFQQDAQAEITELTQELQLEFQKKITPLIQQMAQEKGLYLLLSRAESGIVWWDAGLDLTGELVKKLDALTPKQATAPAAPATRPAAPPRLATPTPAAPAAPKK